MKTILNSWKVITIIKAQIVYYKDYEFIYPSLSIVEFGVVTFQNLYQILR